MRACIGTSETNNDEFTLEKLIKKFIIEITTKETKCRDIIFAPIIFDEINDIINKLNFNINILYHMKTIHIDKYYSNTFKFGYDGLLFKSISNSKNNHDNNDSNNVNNDNNDNNDNNINNINNVNNVNDSIYQYKYSLTSISNYFDNKINDKESLLNELSKSMNFNTTLDTFKLFYNEGIVINSNLLFL